MLSRCAVQALEDLQASKEQRWKLQAQLAEAAEDLLQKTKLEDELHACMGSILAAEEQLETLYNWVLDSAQVRCQEHMLDQLL